MGDDASVIHVYFSEFLLEHLILLVAKQLIPDLLSLSSINLASSDFFSLIEMILEGFFKSLITDLVSLILEISILVVGSQPPDDCHQLCLVQEL